MNKYENEVLKYLKQFYKDEHEMYDSSQYGLWPSPGALKINPYDLLIKRLVRLLKQDLKYYEYFPDYLQVDKNIIDAYCACINTIFVNDDKNGELYSVYKEQVDTCWSVNDLIERMEQLDADIYETYIPSEVETGILKK